MEFKSFSALQSVVSQMLVSAQANTDFESSEEYVDAVARLDMPIIGDKILMAIFRADECDLELTIDMVVQDVAGNEREYLTLSIDPERTTDHICSTFNSALNQWSKLERIA